MNRNSLHPLSALLCRSSFSRLNASMLLCISALSNGEMLRCTCTALSHLLTAWIGGDGQLLNLDTGCWVRTTAPEWMCAAQALLLAAVNVVFVGCCHQRFIGDSNANSTGIQACIYMYVCMCINTKWHWHQHAGNFSWEANCEGHTFSYSCKSSC